MAPDRCPREDPLQDMKVENVVEVKCDQCGELVEFIVDEKQRRCDGCGASVPNPKFAPDTAQ